MLKVSFTGCPDVQDVEGGVLPVPGGDAPPHRALGLPPRDLHPAQLLAQLPQLLRQQLLLRPHHLCHHGGGLFLCLLLAFLVRGLSIYLPASFADLKLGSI